MPEPVTRYAKCGGLHVAYQVWGDGPLDLVLVPGFISNVDDVWDDPFQSAFMKRLSAFARVTIFDKPGTGVSDPIEGPQPLEERMEVVRAVMDEVGIERAALFGISEGGPLSLVFTATYPHRVSHLILSGTFARVAEADDFLHGWSQAEFVRRFSGIDAWGTGALAEFFFPDMADDPLVREAMGRFERRGASPAMARRILDLAHEIDVRDVLSAIHVPTLVHHRAGDQVVPVGCGRHLVENIEGAEYFEQSTSTHAPWFDDSGGLAERVEEFLTGSVRVHDVGRVLATVLFTDIVDSTARAAAEGDHQWRQLLDHHDRITEAEVSAARGRLVKHTGDGAFALFDRPAAAVRCAQAIRDEVLSTGLEVRAGLHTGEVELRGDDVGGIGVHIGARIAGLAGAGEVLVSRTIPDLAIGSGLEFLERGDFELKGVPGAWQVFAAVG